MILFGRYLVDQQIQIGLSSARDGIGSTMAVDVITSKNEDNSDKQPVTTHFLYKLGDDIETSDSISNGPNIHVRLPFISIALDAGKEPAHFQISSPGMIHRVHVYCGQTNANLLTHGRSRFC